MNHRNIELDPGIYLVATPIGNARDITLRALDILASADVIAAEDTRTAKKLLEIHGVGIGARKITAYHDHSSRETQDYLLRLAGEGKSVAVVSEAGTPLLSDPGYGLVAEAALRGVPVTAAPGASALLAAVCVAGLPSDRIYFAGFLPPKSAARQAAMIELARLPATLVFYESPRRVRDFLADLDATLGPERQVAICRELTKKFEEVLRGTPPELLAKLGGEDPRGECVILVRRSDTEDIADATIRSALTEAMKTMRIKDAATAVAGSLNLARRDVYQIALSLKDE